MPDTIELEIQTEQPTLWTKPKKQKQIKKQEAPVMKTNNKQEQENEHEDKDWDDGLGD